MYEGDKAPMMRDLIVMNFRRDLDVQLVCNPYGEAEYRTTAYSNKKDVVVWKGKDTDV